jgi:hypothetical protein
MSSASKDTRWHQRLNNFEKALIQMIRSRNLSTHTYHQDTAKEIAEKIQKTYFPLFEAFLKKMNELKLEK